MAQNVIACHVSVLRCFCIFFIVTSLLAIKTHSVLVYERQMLLNIRDSLLSFPCVGQRFGGLLPPLVPIPEELCWRGPVWTPSKRRRWRGGRVRSARSGKRVRSRSWKWMTISCSDPEVLGLFPAFK